VQTFQTNLRLNMVKIGIFGGKIKISVFGKKGCIFRSLCFSEPVLFCFWTVELLNYFCSWTVLFLNCFASKLLSFWTIFASELVCFWSEFCSWTVLLLNCWASELFLLLNCWASELFLLLNCFASKLSCTSELNRASEQNCCFWAAPCSATLDFSLRTRMLFFENDLYLENWHFETNLVENIHWIILFGNSCMNSWYDFMNCWWLCMLHLILLYPMTMDCCHVAVYI